MNLRKGKIYFSANACLLCFCFCWAALIDEVIADKPNVFLSDGRLANDAARVGPLLDGLMVC